MAEPTPAPSLTFLGAAETVTGSKYLLETATTRILVDCGLFQGAKTLRRRNWEGLASIGPDRIDAVVLTHAHLDHSGYLPALSRDGFGGPVYMTPDTQRLARIVLADAGRLQEEDAEYANRSGSSKHSPALALYTEADAYAAMEQFRPIPFRSAIAVGDITVELYFAGHILGSASAHITLPNGEVIVFSGDVGRFDHPLLDAPQPIGKADWVVVESTYGDRVHDPEAADRFAEAIRRGLARGGAIVIPSFAVDRTEVVLHHLARMARAGELDGVPITVDSPMALDALEAYRDAARDDRGDIRDGVRASDFDVPGLREARTSSLSKEIDRFEGRQIIIASSGMATGGRVLHHLERFLPERDTTVLLVGYQAAGTRGRALQDGERSLKMHGRYVSVRAHIEQVKGLSVHADQEELLRWLRSADAEPACVFVTHGEPGPSNTFARLIAERLDWTAGVPSHGERVLLRRSAFLDEP